MKTSALSAISQSGAINAEQMLQLVQSNLKKADDGSVKVLNGGVEEDINVYLAKLKNPGSGLSITSNQAHKLAWVLSQLQELLVPQVSLILGWKVVLT